jgi:hypothetical protein
MSERRITRRRAIGGAAAGACGIFFAAMRFSGS